MAWLDWLRAAVPDDPGAAVLCPAGVSRRGFLRACGVTGLSLAVPGLAVQKLAVATETAGLAPFCPAPGNAVFTDLRERLTADLVAQIVQEEDQRFLSEITGAGGRIAGFRLECSEAEFRRQYLGEFQLPSGVLLRAAETPPSSISEALRYLQQGILARRLEDLQAQVRDRELYGMSKVKPAYASWRSMELMRNALVKYAADRCPLPSDARGEVRAFLHSDTQQAWFEPCYEPLSPTDV